MAASIVAFYPTSDPVALFSFDYEPRILQWRQRTVRPAADPPVTGRWSVPREERYLIMFCSSFMRDYRPDKPIRWESGITTHCELEWQENKGTLSFRWNKQSVVISIRRTPSKGFIRLTCPGCQHKNVTVFVDSRNGKAICQRCDYDPAKLSAYVAFNSWTPGTPDVFTNKGAC